MKKRYYDYDTLCGAMHDVVLGSGAKHRCIDAGMILDLPQADVVERKKGKWIVYEGEMTCSCCETTFYTDMCEYIDGNAPKFCPWCGADMRKENDNG